MFQRAVITLVIALSLALTPAFALDATLATPAATDDPATVVAKTIETMVPGNTSGAAFINVRRIFALYGDLIRRTPQYSQLEALIAAGCPDPSKEIDQVGISSNLEAMDKSPVGVVVTGKIDVPRLMAFAQSQNVAFTQSVYRGVTLHTATLDKTSTQLGFVDENTTMVTVDAEGQHQNSRDIIETLSGRADSFAAVNHFALQATYLANVSLKITPELKRLLGNVPPQFEAVKHIDFLSGSVIAEERTRDAQADISATCDTEESAAALEQLLNQLVQALAGQGGSAGDVLSKVKISRTGKTVTLSVVIPRQDMEGWVSSTR